MAQIQKGDTTFQITDELQAKFPELIKLIIATESMDDDERQYWFDIMPSMTDAQIDRLYDILETERKKLQELEVKYQKEIKTLNEKHLIEWQEMQVKEGKKKVAAAKAEEG
jgi:Spy/CpxP family protein refolding chaperone